MTRAKSPAGYLEFELDRADSGRAMVDDYTDYYAARDRTIEQLSRDRKALGHTRTE